VERPKHRVTISQPFFMGKCEVTIGQWKTLMGDLPEGMKASDFPVLLKEFDSQPVVSVTWNETQQFIAKLNAQNDGHVYRLPSEAEWEYACRGNNPGWYAGKPELLAWYGDNSGNDSNLDSLASYGRDAAGYNKLLIDNENRSHIVGTTKQANAFGLYDMHGNVWEWCDDYWHEDYSDVGIPKNGSVWRGDGNANLRAARGGSWKCGLNWIRSAVRQPYGLECSYGPSCRDVDLGFRVAAMSASSQ
jgi:formylglycine-generating enzyme required for sulfatase activity